MTVERIDVAAILASLGTRYDDCEHEEGANLARVSDRP